MHQKPQLKPSNPNFSSGPCRKRPGYDPGALDTTLLGRSHRAPAGVEALDGACRRTAMLLGIPSDYLVGIVPASDTGAVEMALWNLLGPRPVDVLAWETFGLAWATDIREQLHLDDVRYLTADYGALPRLEDVAADHDIVFTWNGTTSGVCVPHDHWLLADRRGLAICDATSAVFAMRLPWEKLDVVTFSWQKALGGEGGHGMLVLSPRAVERLESHTPSWPVPKVFRLTKNGKLMRGVFEGKTINTPSMLCVADYHDALNWVEREGGVDTLVERSEASLAVIDDFVRGRDWIDFLARDPATRSTTSVCLTVDANLEQIREMGALLAGEDVAHDIVNHRDAPPSLRIWCGATVPTEDVAALLPWLEWAYRMVVL